MLRLLLSVLLSAAAALLFCAGAALVLRHAARETPAAPCARRGPGPPVRWGSTTA